MSEWRNWAGNQRAEAEVAVPGSVAELRGLITGGRRVRPIGSGHSFTPIGRPADLQLRLDALRGIVSADPATGLVTAYAGTTIAELNAALEHLGLALTNLGDIDRQTIAGALSTGTHGTGATYGGLATQLRGFTLLTADGELRAAGPGDPLFDLGRVGLGALGVLVTLTLQAVPLFALHAREGSSALDAIVDAFDSHADHTDHFEFYWFPHTRRVLTKHNTRRPIPASTGSAGLHPLSRARFWWDDEILSNGVFGATVALGERLPGTVRPLARVAARALSPREYSDVSHRVFVSPRRVRFVESEYAVPREHGMAVLRELVATVERSRWNISFPVEVRVAAADDIPLSTGFERANVYLAVHTAPGAADQAAYFAAFEAIAGQVGGRPHWGKMHTLTAAELSERYPRFGEFVALRDELDPGRVFGNEHLDRILG
jgi:L-gulono-1,4-lactone dehydrogenase